MHVDLCPTVVRPALRTDLPALAVIWQQLMDDHQSVDERFALAPDAPRLWHEQAEEVLARPAAFLLLAEQAGRAVGFCLGWVATNPPIYRTAEVGFISEIAVERTVRRQGVGRQLMKGARRFFREQGVNEYYLSTAVWNDKAQAFWQALGGEVMLLRYRFVLADAPNRERS